VDKTCKKCNETKSRDDFHKQRASKDGHSPWCKTCMAAYSLAKNAAARAARMLGA
jgi:hypothetical protein